MSKNALSAYQIIQKKRDGKKLTNPEIEWFVKGITNKAIPDYQTSSLLMAIFLKGLDTSETAALTRIMLYSGKTLDFKDPHSIDKHSTGGIGDKTSFIVAPAAAACGVKVPMMAGRGLGHTGGTVDKIESLKGFNTSINLDRFERQVKKIGLALIGQTKEIAPADKILYSLRDVTATIESIPLITASIMSKKLAEGTSGMIMDVKAGNGAFMKTRKDALALAKSMEGTALKFHKNIMTVISDMSQPLGNTIGNSLEIIEAIETLKGKGPDDLAELSHHLAGGMIYLAGLAKSHQEGIKKSKLAVKKGLALKKFKQLISSQGGNPAWVDDYSHLPVATSRTVVKALEAGYVHSIDTARLGIECVNLGGGRKKVGEKIDFSVGLTIHRKLGQRTSKSTPLMTIHHHEHQRDLAHNISEIIRHDIIKIRKDRPKAKRPLIIKTTTRWSK